MYTLEFLPSAQKDLIGIMHYISFVLKNPEAAEDFISKFEVKTNGLSDFPYFCPAYIPFKPLKHEYRKLIVDNYLVFYWVDEYLKKVTIARVIHSKRNFKSLLK